VPPTGKATFDVLKMSREGLALPLRAAVGKARKDNKPVRRAGVRVGENGHTRTVDLEVIPLRSQHERYFLILFERPESVATKRATLESKASIPTATVRAETAGAEVESFRLGAGRPIDDRGVDDAGAGLALPRLTRCAECMHASFDAPGNLRLGAAWRQHRRERNFVARHRCLPRAVALPLALGAHPARADHETEVVELSAIA